MSNVDFGLLQPQQAPSTQVIAAPQASAGGDLSSGLKGLLGGLKKAFGTNQVEQVNDAVQAGIANTPTSQIASSVLPSSQQQAISSGTQQGANFQPRNISGNAANPTFNMTAGTPQSIPNGASTQIGQTQGQFSQPNGNPLSIQNVQGMMGQAYPNNPTMQSIGTAQAAQESGLMSGQPSQLASQHNNLFGMKGTGTAGSVQMPTTEYKNGQPYQTTASFAAYKTPQDSIDAYKKQMQSPRYTGVLNASNPADAATALQKAGYATDPMYSKSLNDIVNKMNTGKSDTGNYYPNQKQSPPNDMINHHPNQQQSPTLLANPQKINTNQPMAASIHQATAASQSGNPMDVAKSYLGDTAKANSQVLSSFFEKSGMGKVNPQTTPWCAAFANSVLKSSGMSGTGSLSAKSFLKWGQPTTNPQQGDIAVFNDMTGKNDPAHGHVGFVNGITTHPDGSQWVSTLGGNESGGVNIKEYPMSKVAGFRTAPTANELASKSVGTMKQGQQGQQPTANQQAQLNPSQQQSPVTMLKNLYAQQQAGVLSPLLQQNQTGLQASN